MGFKTTVYSLVDVFVLVNLKYATILFGSTHLCLRRIYKRNQAPLENVLNPKLKGSGSYLC